MSATLCEKRTVSLPSEQGRYIDQLVDSVAAYDALQADPSRAIPASQVFATLRAHHQEREARKA